MSTLRQLSLEVGVLSRADGSARFGFGLTKALASVSGPIEARLNTELPSRAALDVAVRPLSGIPGTYERTLSKNIRSILEQVLLLSHHPRTLIQIMIQCLTPPTPPSHAQPYPADAESFVANPNPSLTAAVINASSIALLNASSVPMSGVLCAVAVGHSRSDDRAERGLVLDPENVQETCSRAGCFAFVFGEGTYGPDGELIWSDWSGAFESQEYLQAVAMACSGAKLVHDYIRSELARQAGMDNDGMDAT